MVKYYAGWNKLNKCWWVFDLWFLENKNIESILLFWKITKVVNRIPIWDNSDDLLGFFGLFRYPPCFDRYFEIREFTPQDALLAKCGKIK